MKIYVFTSDIEVIKELEELGVDGVLHTYNAYQLNAFIAIPKYLAETKIKHMVAVRPYTISPQLLSQIGMSFNQLYGEGLLQINLISGWIKENEKDIGGILGSVNDNSSGIDRSDYLIKYVDVLESLDNKTLDYYVSVTNSFTFDVAAKYNSKMIIDYNHFKENKYDIKNKRIMVMMNTVSSDGSLITHEELLNIVRQLKLVGIEEIIFPRGDQIAFEHTISFIKKYKNISELTMVE